jgi:hypothetical protein
LVASYEANVEAVLAASEVNELSASAVLEHCEQAGREAIASLYEAASELAARSETRPLCPAGHGRMARHVRFRRPVISLAGEWRGVFQRFRCEACLHGACPSYDDWLCYGCTPATVAAVLSKTARTPYEEAEGDLAQHRVYLSDNTLQRIMLERGGARASQRRAEAEAVMRLEQSLPAISRPRRLYVEADAFLAKVDGQWRWVYVAVFFETSAEGLDDQGRKPKPERESIVAHQGTLAEFEPLVVAEAQRRGIMSAAEVVLLGDGGNWVWPMLERLVPVGAKVVQALDWYHLTKHLADAVRAVWGEVLNELAYKRLKDSAWAGDSNEVLRQLGAWREQVLADQKRGQRMDGEAAAKELTRVINYVREHRGRMNYRALDLDGYQCGSGQVESRCNQFGLRVKGGRFDWSTPGINAVLAVRADELSDPAVRRLAA